MIKDKLTTILEAGRLSLIKRGEPEKLVSIVAVSKTKSIAEMLEYAAAARGLSIPVVFGENYIQEIKVKRPAIPSGSELHMIGPLQSNKVRDAVILCDVIQSVHSIKIIDLIAKEALRLGKRQRIMLQINVGRDEKKSGFYQEELEGALAACEKYAENLTVEGLMTILPYDPDPEKSRPFFKSMTALRERIQHQGLARYFAGGVVRLSMGMSDDFAIAIEEGTDLVRIGTALFGHRS